MEADPRPALGARHPAHRLHRRRAHPARRSARADRPRREQRADHRAEHQRPPTERSGLRAAAGGGRAGPRPDHARIALTRRSTTQMVRLHGAWKQTVAGIQQRPGSTAVRDDQHHHAADNARDLAETLDFLADLGVPTVGLNALIYSGQGCTVGTGLDEAELAAAAGDCPPDHRATRPAPDLVHAHPVLPLRPDGSSTWASKAARPRSTTCASSRMAPCCPASPTTSRWATCWPIHGSRSGTMSWPSSLRERRQCAGEMPRLRPAGRMRRRLPACLMRHTVKRE